MSRELCEDSALSRYDEILNELINLAINRFNWSNLPLGLTSEHLEKMLIEHGQLACFKTKNQGLLILPCFGETDLNSYGLPTRYRVNALNGLYNDSLDIEEIVLLKNNPLGTGDLITLQNYAKRIDDVEMTQDVNLFQQCIPKILLSDENSKLTVKNIIKQVKEFKFVVLGKKSLINNISSGDILDTTAPYLLDKLQVYKKDLRCEIMTFLGINNNNIEKKERLITDEVNANNELISIMLDLMFDLRVKFCEEVNAKFDINIKVKKREVKESGEVHNNTRENNRE